MGRVYDALRRAGVTERGPATVFRTRYQIHRSRGEARNHRIVPSAAAD